MKNIIFTKKILQSDEIKVILLANDLSFHVKM